MANQKENNKGGGYPREFVQAVKEAIAHLGWKVKGWEPGCVVCVDQEGGDSRLGLDNVARRCREMEPGEWVGFITDHFRRVSDGTQRARRSEDLHSVAHRVLVRLSQPLSDRQMAEMVWWKSVEEKVVVVLVVDHPDSMSYVTRRMVEESGEPGEHWLEVALENLRGQTNPEMLEPIDADTGILLCCTGDAYDAPRALVLDSLLPEAPFGALVGVPNRDRLLVLPLQPSALAKLHFVKLVAQQSYRQAPYPISNEVFWVRDGRWLRIPVEIRGTNINVTPPDEFVAVLQQMMGE
jgi:hypothetical protein